MKPDNKDIKNEIEVLEYLQTLSKPQAGVILITDNINGTLYVNLELSRLTFEVTKDIEIINNKKMIKRDLLMPIIDKYYETAIILPDNHRITVFEIK